MATHEEEARHSDPSQLFQPNEASNDINRRLGEGAPPPPSQFWNVPRRNPYFTGREDILARLHDALTADGSAALGQAAITGLGGIGKTQTAVEYCHRYGDVYNSIVWVRAETDAEVRGSFVTVSQGLGLADAETYDEEAIAAVRRWLETNDGWLLVFDNVEQPDSLKPYLPAHRRGRLLVTSRASTFVVLGIRNPLRIKTLPPGEAQAFLLDRAERTEASDEERQAVADLAEALGNLPLALEQAGAYVAATGSRFASYLASFQTRQLGLLEETGPETGDYPASVATTWSMSFQEVGEASPASVDLLRVLAFLTPDAIPLELLEVGARELGGVLAHALGTKPPGFWARLRRLFLDTPPLPAAADPLAISKILKPLVRFSLVERDIENRTVSVHRLVQTVARATLDEKAERTWAERVVRAVDGAFLDVEFKNWPVCERLYPQALEVAGLVERLSIGVTEAGRLLHRAGHYAYDRARYKEAELLYLRSLATWEKALGKDDLQVGTALNYLALLYRAQGRYREAEPLYLRSLAIVEKAQGAGHPSTGQLLNNLAELHHAQGRYEKAEPLYLRSLATWEELLGEDHPQVGTTLNDLAGLYDTQGRYEEAEPLYLRSLAIIEKAVDGDHLSVGQTLHDLDGLYHAQGRYEETGPLYQHDLATLENSRGEDHASILAGLYRAQGRYTDAEPLYRRSLALRDRTLGKDHPRVGAALNDLAGLCHAQGRYEDAEPLYLRSLKIFERALGGDHPSVGQLLNNLARLYRAQGRFEVAEPFYERSLTILENALGSEHPLTTAVRGNYERFLSEEPPPEAPQTGPTTFQKEEGFTERTSGTAPLKKSPPTGRHESVFRLPSPLVVASRRTYDRSPSERDTRMSLHREKYSTSPPKKERFTERTSGNESPQKIPQAGRHEGDPVADRRRHMGEKRESLVSKNFLKHLAKGGAKSIPLFGGLVEEMIFGTLDEEAAQEEAQKLRRVLAKIEAGEESRSTNLAELAADLRQGASFRQEVVVKLDELGAAILEPRYLSDDIEQFIEGYLQRHEALVEKLESIVTKLPTECGETEHTVRDSSDRLDLIIALSRLTYANLALLVTSLGASGDVPEGAAAKERVAKLVEWADSPAGPGVEGVKSVAKRVLGLDLG